MALTPCAALLEACLQIAAFVAPCTANLQNMQSEVAELGIQPATDAKPVFLRCSKASRCVGLVKTMQQLPPTRLQL